MADDVRLLVDVGRSAPVTDRVGGAVRGVAAVDHDVAVACVTRYHAAISYSSPRPWFILMFSTWHLSVPHSNMYYDLYGDAVIRMWQTPGHAPDHQSFEITLPSSGSILLTVDAAYTTDHWDEKALPGFLASVVDTVRSVRKLHRIAARSDSTVVTGHDPDAWPKFKQAPEFYD